MSDLAARLDRFIGCRVLCIGDLMIDRYVYGSVERISPEAPIPVLHTRRETATLGGAGNVVRNIASLGGHVGLIGVVGEDQSGKDLVAELETLPMVSAQLIADKTRPTTQKTRYIAGGQQLLRADHESAKAVSAGIEEQIIQTIFASLEDSHVIVLSDYAKGVLTPHVIAEVTRLARDARKIVIVDPKGRDFKRYRGATYLTPNRKELSEAVGHAIAGVAEAEEAARSLIHDLQIENVLVKLGSDGVCMVCRDQPAVHFHTKAREVFDVSGAGDTVAATFALAIAGDFTANEAAELANIAGSVVVGKVGTATVTRDEIEHELLQDSVRTAEDKVVGTATIVEMAERWRKQGLKVGFTNGCFDLLHPGHVALLRQARAACDRLVVGLNSDVSVRRLKGHNRPVQNEAARSTVLSSLSYIHNVVIFAEDTPYELIKALRPDVLVKGGNYNAEDIVGADLVKSWGGEVLIGKMVDGHSTTGTIAKLAK